MAAHVAMAATINTLAATAILRAPALAVLPLKLQEIAVAWAAGGQMVQVRLCLGQRHLVRGNGGDNLAARASDALGIRELVPKSATQYA